MIENGMQRSKGKHHALVIDFDEDMESQPLGTIKKSVHKAVRIRNWVWTLVIMTAKMMQASGPPRNDCQFLLCLLPVLGPVNSGVLLIMILMVSPSSALARREECHSL
jgi:hypothetical protein